MNVKFSDSFISNFLTFKDCVVIFLTFILSFNATVVQVYFAMLSLTKTTQKFQHLTFLTIINFSTLIAEAMQELNFKYWAW